ncbi:hypothetical protein DH2020_046183 [Rehmannia glutinosa]|uniref:Uncharacterized protein n=1 Tax=Rehmannia glutinosa TaxID=99300 RepID=A0ABR0UC02_REHGL
MALEQTVAIKNTLLLYQKPRPISSSPFISLNHKSLRRSASIPRIKCSFDYNGSGTAATNNNGLYEYERYAAAGPQHPRPPEIQWKKELCNSVQLIGVVGAPVQIKHLPSGKVVACGSGSSGNDKIDALGRLLTRILRHMASELKLDMRSDGYVKVEFMQNEFLIGPYAYEEGHSWLHWSIEGVVNDTNHRINLTFWDELAQVAFQHVEKGHQIFVSGRLVSDTVENDEGKQQTYYKVVVQQLNFIERSPSSVPLYNGDSNSVKPGRKQNSYAANSTLSTEELWQAFFANPLEWWDNRKNKRSPNYPDFKHKDTGEALWVEGRNNPSWVKSQLAVLDSKMESYHEHNSSLHSNFMSAADSLGPL